MQLWVSKIQVCCISFTWCMVPSVPGPNNCNSDHLFSTYGGIRGRFESILGNVMTGWAVIPALSVSVLRG